MKMMKLEKLKLGDKVAILSPSFAAPGMFPEVFELGLKRLREVFKLEPVEFPTTRKLGATTEERAKDLIDAFENKDVKAVIATIGGDDQITYVKNLPSEPFVNNPKPFFGYSDNSHFMNHLWLNGIPSFYGGSVMTQLAMQSKMDDYTVEYMKHALFGDGEMEIISSDTYNEIGLNWTDVSNLSKSREYEENDGWHWDQLADAKGVLWGGCIESIDEMLRHGIKIPSLKNFEKIILMTETSEEIPSAEYVARVYRSFGERGILERVQGVLVGRPKAWEFDKPYKKQKRIEYRDKQMEMIIKTIRTYNDKIPIVQNMNFGHTDPQIPMPYGGECTIIGSSKKISVEF
jgi:muramoyltetrapeptide carboxypeptidase LdcA involved in peptidoglycan recycling